MTWTPACEALPPVGAVCVGLHDDGEGGASPSLMRLNGAAWQRYENPSWESAYPPRLWAPLPVIPDEWVSPCPVGGEIVDYEENVCSCGRVGGVTP